jgi:hypothetical protein
MFSPEHTPMLRFSTAVNRPHRGSSGNKAEVHGFEALVEAACGVSAESLIEKQLYSLKVAVKPPLSSK